jgi:hypothetical protein
MDKLMKESRKTISELYGEIKKSQTQIYHLINSRRLLGTSGVLIL